MLENHNSIGSLRSVSASHQEESAAENFPFRSFPFSFLIYLLFVSSEWVLRWNTGTHITVRFPLLFRHSTHPVGDVSNQESQHMAEVFEVEIHIPNA